MTAVTSSIMFDEKYPHEAGFSAYFNKNIAPELARWEDRRQILLMLMIFAVVVGAAVDGIFVLPRIYSFQSGVVIVENHTFQSLFLIAFMILFGPAGLIYMYYKSHFKNVVMPLVAGFFKGHTYRADRFISPAFAGPFDLIPTTYDRCAGGDLMYQEGVFASSFLKLYRIERDHRGRKHNRNIFSGWLAYIPLRVMIAEPIKIVPDGGGILNWFKDRFTNLPRVSLEDPVFEKYFQVYGADQIEARRVLTPHFMDLLLRLHVLLGEWKKDISVLDDLSRLNLQELTASMSTLSRRGTPGFSAAFRGNKFLIVVRSGADEMFDTGDIFKRATMVNPIRQVLFQIHLLHQIQETLGTLNASFVTDDPGRTPTIAPMESVVYREGQDKTWTFERFPPPKGRG